MNKQATRWVFIGIMLLAAVVRLYALGDIPHGVYIDEIAMLVDAKSVSQSGLDMHGRPWYQVLYPSYGDYKLPVYLWLASASVSLFGVNDWVLRLPSAVAGIMTVLVAGLIARALIADSKLQRWAQLGTMLVVTISPWSIMFSRTGFEGHVGQFLLATSTWLALKARDRWWLLLLSAGLGGLATYSYFSVRFVWPVVFTVVSGIFLIKWTTSVLVIKELVTKYVLPLTVFGLLLLPMLRSPLYADSNRFRLSTDSVLNIPNVAITSNMYREWAGNTVVDRVIFHRWWLIGRELALNYADNVSPVYLFITGDPNLRHGTGEHGLFLLSLLPALLIGGWYLYDRDKRVALLLAVWWLAALLPASVPQSTPHALRSLNALVPISVIMGVGLGFAWISLRKSVKVLGLLIMALTASSFIYHYFTIYPADSGSAWQQGHHEVVTAMYAHRDYDHIVILPFDERFYLWMMAYGPFSASDFHSWQSRHFMFKDHSNVTFDALPSWNELGESVSRLLVVGRVEQVGAVLDQHPSKMVRSETITSVDGQPLFTVAVLERAQ